MSRTPQEQLIEHIKQSNKILITFKKEFTTDSLAAALGLANFLKKLKKSVDVVCYQFSTPKKLKFLPGIKDVMPQSYISNKFIVSIDIQKNPIEEFSYDIIDNKLNLYIVSKIKEFKQEDLKLSVPKAKYDLTIVLDTNELEQLDKVYDNNPDFFFKVPIINIDHVADNEQFGQINLVDLTSVATSEIVYEIISTCDKKLIDEDIATCLLTGIIAETKGFHNVQITPKVLTIASELIALGAKREEIVENLFRTKSLSTLKIWGKVLLNLKYDPINKLVWSTLNQEDFALTQADPDCLPEVINDLIANAPEAKIVALLYEKSKEIYSALVYSEKNINILELTKSLHPHGSKNLANIELIESSVNIATDKILNEIKKNLKTIPLNNI